jgi:hypothetical protein
MRVLFGLDAEIPSATAAARSVRSMSTTVRPLARQDFTVTDVIHSEFDRPSWTWAPLGIWERAIA